MADSKTKLNMKHGFMQSIIKNQVDRDNYDKEVKAKLQEEKTTVKKSLRQRKPDLQTYIPPTNRRKTKDDEDYNDVTQFESLKIEYEDEEGNVSELLVCKDDDIGTMAENFGASKSMTPLLLLAFKKMVLEESAAIWP